MKIRPILYSAVVAFGVSPLAQAASGESIQRCMDAFAAQNFPNTNVSFAVDHVNQGPTPLIAQSGTQFVQLIATSKSSGRVIAKTTCQVREGVKREGQVIVAPVDNEVLVN